ncbi:AMSH-like ubiquitin thioesterase 3 [Citrus sinensis]|nr:AMSH-like ubiquitin thioesterase 3 [Citrus sinensis]
MESVLSLDDGRWLHPAEKSCPPMVHEAREDPFQFPVNMMQDFLRLAQANTEKNLETCGVLAGSLKNRVFHITTLIIPKQESTSDSCQTLNEEEIFEVQDRLSLFPLGWIHTHPSQTCFMSSVDLHTHYSYQIMLPEAVAIVMAPTDTSSPHGIFHLSDPGGVSVIRNCQQRGFHPHEEPEDGSPLYEHCSHVFMNAKLQFDVVDLR